MPKFVASAPKRIVEAWPDSERPLPPVVRSYLESGAAEGTRNETIFKVAQQFHACGYSDSEAETWIMPRAKADGVSDAESRQAIKSAFRSSKVTEPISLQSAPVSKAVKPEQPEADFIRALKAAFEPDEGVAVVSSYRRDDGEWKPGKADIKTRREWERWHSKMGDINRFVGKTPGGAFMGINPLRPDAESRSNDAVTAFRHVLVEFDGPDDGSGKPEQRQKIEASGFPVSVMLDSGRRSVHAWVRVDATTREQWEERRDVVFKTLESDPKNKDLARVSRCPGAIRVLDDGEKVQKLLAVKIGAKSWGEWEKQRLQLPAIRSLREMVGNPANKPAPLLKGILFPGCKMIICSTSKGRKSWVLLDLALSVAAGWEWLGVKTAQGPVLYVNFELKDWMAEERIGLIAQARGIKLVQDALDNFQCWNLRGYSAPIASLAPMILDRIKETKYSLVIFDPIYKGLGDEDENDAGSINELCNQLENVCQQTGAALAFAHHFAKGDPWDKTPLDRPSGSGVFARDPDSVVILTPGRLARGEKDNREGVVSREDKDSLVFMDVILRASAPMPSGWLRWHHGYFAPDKGVKRVISIGDSSLAGKYGAIAAKMPPLARVSTPDGKPSPACPVMLWLAENCGVSAEDAFRIWDNLRKPAYGLLVNENGLWRGRDNDDGIPF